MAEYTAFVEAGEALIEMLQEQMSPEPINDKELIALVSPHEAENSQLTVHLYHIEEDTLEGYGGFYEETPTLLRQAPGRYILRYIITAHSKAPSHLKEKDQLRMIGKVVQVLRDNTVIPDKFLKGSLEGTGSRLEVSLERPSYEELTRIWGNSQQSTPYKTSIVCRMRGLLIDSTRTRKISRITKAGFDFVEQGVQKMPNRTKKGGGRR